MTSLTPRVKWLLAVAGVLVWRRAPFIVVVVAAAVATALVRAI